MIRLLGFGAALVAGLGCTSSDGSKPKHPGPPGVERRDIEIKHESCDLESRDAVALDANGDKRPEIITVISGGVPACRAIDLNLDGNIDVFVYYDARGQERRRESAFDRSGLPNEISYYQAAALVRKERDTTADHKIDTWDYYQGGRLVREERDSAGDGYVNQWWAFNRPDNTQCAIVMSDGDSDGKPDPQSQVDICAEDDAAKAQGGKRPAPAASSAAVPGAPPGTPALGAPPGAPVPGAPPGAPVPGAPPSSSGSSPDGSSVPAPAPAPAPAAPPKGTP